MGEKQRRCQNAQKFIKNLFTYSLYCQKKVCYNKISNNKVQCDLCNSYCAKRRELYDRRKDLGGYKSFSNVFV